MPTFVLNDQNTVNSYGFKIDTSGIDISRFLANPVMLDNHNNSLQSVLGKWKNISKHSGQLLADDDFDIADPNVKPIKEKVDRGYIKGVSMGVLFMPEYMSIGNDKIPVLTRSELMEASICAIPSNASSLKLYNSKGNEMSKGEIQLSINRFTGGVTFSSRLTSSYSHVLTVEDFMKLTDSQKMDFKANHEHAYAALFDRKSAISYHNANHQMHVDKLNGRFAGQPVNYSVSQINTVDDFMKLNDAEKIHFKNNNLQAYKALFVR